MDILNSAHQLNIESRDEKITTLDGAIARANDAITQQGKARELASSTIYAFASKLARNHYIIDVFL